MKKMALSTIMLAALAVVACNKNEETITASPELELADFAMTVVAAGGLQTVSYTLTDPAEDGQVSASALEGCDWISGFDTSEDGEVAFEVAANEDETSREGGLTVTYTWSGGELTRTLAVTQEGKEQEQPEPGEEPEIRPAQDRYEVEAAGGQLEILYEIVNPVEDGVFSASLDPDCGWISDLNTDTDGVVTLTVAENTDQAGRESVITLSYSDITEDVTVYQSGAQSAEGPSDIETENGFLTFSFAGEATDAAEIHYTIVNPKDGAYVRVVEDCDWIDGVDCSQEGIVTFALSENSTGAERSASFSLRYTTDVAGVGTVDLCKKDLTVKQLPKVEQGEVTDDVKFTFSAVRNSSGGVSITVTADNNTSFFLADTRFASQV